MGLLKRFIELRDSFSSTVAFPSDYFAGWFGVAPSESGVEVNELTAMQIASYVGCVRVLSSAVATTKLHVWRVEKEPGGHPHEVIADDHPLEFVLSTSPNNETTAADFFRTVMVHLCLTGNAYAEKSYNGAGQPAALYLRSPFRTIPYRRSSGELIYKTNETPTGYERTIEGTDMCHFRGMGLDSLVGLSPVKYYAREVLGSDLAAQSYSAKFYANNAAPGGYLSSPTHMANDKKLQAAQSWQSAHSRGNAHSMAILDGGLDWKTVTIPPEQAQFLQTRKFNREQIAAIFGVPVHFLGETVESRITSEQRDVELLNRTLSIYFSQIEQMLNLRLFPSLGRTAGKYFTRFDTSTFAKPTYTDLLKGVQMGRYAGVYTTNEGRRLLGEQPYSDEQHQSEDPADKLWMPVNMIYVSEDMDPPGPATAPGKDKGKGAGAGGNDQSGGNGVGTGKPPRQTGQGGKRDREINHYFGLFYESFNEAVGKLLSRKKRSGLDFQVIFRPILNMVASSFSFDRDALPGEMILPEPTVEFINQYIGKLALAAEAWTEKSRADISANELRNALEVFREQCATPSQQEEQQEEEEGERGADRPSEAPVVRVRPSREPKRRLLNLVKSPDGTTLGAEVVEEFMPRKRKINLIKGADGSTTGAEITEE